MSDEEKKTCGLVMPISAMGGVATRAIDNIIVESATRSAIADNAKPGATSTQ